MAAIRTQREIRQRAPIYLAVLLLINLVVMAIDARDSNTRQRLIRSWIQALASPAQSLSSGASGAGSGFIRQIINFRSTAIENERLKTDLEKTQLELRKAQQEAAETEHLKGLLSLKDQTGYQPVPARVIARDSSIWFNTITINKGSSSGIALNMPVVTGSGIVGRVIALSPWTAQVMMVTDEKAAAGAIVGKLGSSGALGSVKGLGDKGLDGCPMSRRNQRPELCLRFRRVASHKRLRRRQEFLDKRIIDLVLDKHPAARATVLAGIGEHTHRRRLSRPMPIGIGKDNVRRFAAEFE